MNIQGDRNRFLWVKLQLERLCRKKTEDDIMIALECNLPEYLDQLYEQSLSNIFNTGMTARDAAIRVFSWMLHTREPLTSSALLAAVSNGQKSTMELSELMALCGNLVVLDKYCNVIRFAHPSVKDFLARHESFTSAVAHNLLASTCIEVCSQGPVSRRSLQYPSDDFYVYAAMYWPIHSNKAENMAANEDIVNKMISFIFDEDFDITLSFESWLERRREIFQMLANDHAMKMALDAIPDGDAGPLFLISVFGLTSLLRAVFKHLPNLNVNQKNKHGHTPIYLAAALGHSTTLSLLVNHGADVNVQCGKYGSPLHAACFAGHLEAVKTLLELDASMCCGVVFDDAFQAACRGGQEGVALLLIDSSIVKSENDYEKILEGAARAGFADVVEKLQGPPFLFFNNCQPDKVKKKTRRAIQGGQLGILRQFLDRQTNRRDVLPPDSVALATLYNHRILVEFLLDEGLSVHAEGAFGTPLRTACLLNYQPIVRLLLHRGAEINSCGAFGDALQAAAMKGHTKLLKFMTDEGANVNQQSGFYGTALQAAAYHGHHGAVEFLLDVDANVHAKGYSKDAFHAAAEGGHQDVIMLMLRKGYRSYHPLPSLKHRNITPSPYKALMRDASPGRVPGSYRQSQPSRASKVGSAKAIRPITELGVVFRLAEQDPETIRVQFEEVPTAGYIPESYFRRQENYALEAAASAGHEASVKVLLEQRNMLGFSEDQISHAIKVAASNSHGPVVQLLLDDVAKRQSVKPHIESILEVLRQRQQSPIVGLALAQAAKYCSADEIVGIKQNLAADKRDYDPEVSQETLILDFKEGCKVGDIKVIDAILASKHYQKLSTSEIDAGLQLSVLNGQTTVVKLLCESSSLKERLPPSGEEAFVVAAANGSVDMIRLLASYWTAELTKADSVAAIRALVAASGSGHIDVVRYLVKDMSADINALAHDKPVESDLDESWWTSSSFPVAPNAFEESQASEEESTVASVISPLQAALRRFSEFRPSHNRHTSIFFNWENKPTEAERSQHEEVIVFLITNGSKLSDLGGQKKYPIQMAVEFCPIHIVEKFISLDTNINATTDGKSALFAAAGRELSSASIVRRLLAAGATIPGKVEEQEKLLDQALRYFKGNTSREYFHDTIDDPDGRFLEAPSLEYVFSEGPGAVLFDLLHLMPQIAATDIRWTLVMQMAALLNRHLFLDLLLSRGTDSNAIGYYYGTALQAAARCGHISMVRKLLDAGAQVNVIEGRWQTALRAAIVGVHEEVVETLLNHGADMDLRLARQRLYMNDREQASDNALQLGVKSGSLNIVKILLKHGANTVHDETETMHPLILASQQGSVAIVKELLDAGAPINIPGKKRPSYMELQSEDASPMHSAVAGGYLDIIKLLLSHGADLEINVEGSGTPLSVAASKGRADIVRLLLSAGANAADGAALYHAVREGSIEIAQEPLAAGSRSEPVLPLACRQGLLPTIELLLEKVFDGERPETVIDEVFAIHGLDDSVFRLLLDYAHPSMKRFVQVCAAGSLASVESMLDKGGIDINGQIETNGDYPLQVAALHLQPEVVRFLLISGAVVNCKSAKHGSPLISSLEACAASTLLSLKSEQTKSLVDRLYLPEPVTYHRFYTSGPSSFQQISDCEHIVQLLLIHGANIANDDRPFGSPIHVACLIGNKFLVELLLEKGADLSATAGFFEKTMFAAIQGGHPDVVELLLQKAPLTKHIHPEYATPLHLACANGFSAAVRKLLEHGADATVLDAKGRSPLTIALEKKKTQWGLRPARCHTETTLDVILKLARPLHVLDDDLLTAAELYYRDAEDTLTLLFDIDKDVIVPEAVLCNVLKRPNVDNQIIQLLMQRSGGIGVTAKMLTAVETHYNLEKLLEHRPVSGITPEILKSQKELKCMKLLMDIAPETTVTEEVIFRALEIRDVLNRWDTSRKQEEKEVLETLLERSPDIVVSEEMLQAVRCAADMEILLNHLSPGTCISFDVIAAVSKLNSPEAYRTMRPLLKFDPSIRLDPDMVLRMIVWPNAINALEMFLEHDPLMPVSEEIFLRVFEKSRMWDRFGREKLADLMHKYGKSLVFTDKVREVIDDAYQEKSQATKKMRFYSLNCEKD